MPSNTKDLPRAKPSHDQGPYVVHPGGVGQDGGRPPRGDGVDCKPDQRWGRGRGWSRGEELKRYVLSSVSLRRRYYFQRAAYARESSRSTTSLHVAQEGEELAPCLALFLKSRTQNVRETLRQTTTSYKAPTSHPSHDERIRAEKRARGRV